MHKVVLVSIAGAFFAYGCSSGGGGSANPVDWSTLKVFGDGAGVARLVDSENGSQALLIGPNITSIVEAANDDEVDDSIATYSDFAKVNTLQYSTVREGTVTVDGTTANITFYEDNSGVSGIALFELPGLARLGLVTGTRMTGSPTGTFDYVGTHGARDRRTDAIEIGTFDMTIDFDSGTFVYDGDTASSTLDGTGSVDVENARFASSNLSFTANGYSQTASMRGLLHGEDAEGVSAIFHTNESTPLFDGAAAGSKK